MTAINIFRNETDVISFAAGAVICQEGEPGDTMYVVQNGEGVVEGAVVDALSTAQLEIRFANGATQQSNFNDYELLRLNQAPEVECHFIQSDHSQSGLGEPPISAATPAIANAIFAATGTRIRELPFSRAGIVV